MNGNLRNRLLVAAVLATTAPIALVSTTALARDYGHQQQGEQKKGKKAKGDAKAEARAEAPKPREGMRAENRPNRDARPDVRQAQRDRQIAETRDRQAAQAARQEGRHDRQMGNIANQAARQENRAERQQAQVANQAARRDAREDRQAARRLDRAQQQALITTQQSRVNSYRTWQRAQRTAAQQAAAAIQAQNRRASYAYIQDYNNRLWSQQQGYMNTSINYWNDPYFYTGASYRYMRDGSWYTVNNYGYQLLQQAINAGYNEGYRAGRADRMDGWRYDYRGSWVYQNASYGYSGYYLDRGDYSYYFRQGFQRGYEDGYYSRYRYGSYRGGNYSILGAVLNTILAVQAYDRY